MAANPLQVDVILPVYRGLRWVQEAVDSVLKQTYPHWHLTVVDDASPDDTLIHIEELYRSHTDRISFIRLKENRRAAGARMVAIRQTCGDLIAFIDQDDRWQPHKLQRQVERLGGEPTVQAVHTDVEHIDVDGHVIPGSADRENTYRAGIPYDTLERHMLTRQLFFMNSIRLVSAAILRDVFERVGGFDETLFGGEDWEFWVRFAASGYRIARIPVPLVERRLHAGNTSRACFGERNRGLLQTVDQVASRYPALSDLANRRKSLLLRQEILSNLTLGQGGQVQPQIRQLLHMARGRGRIIGYALWMLSHTGPLQRPLSRVGLRLFRKFTRQGGTIAPARLTLI